MHTLKRSLPCFRMFARNDSTASVRSWCVGAASCAKIKLSSISEKRTIEEKGLIARKTGWDHHLEQGLNFDRFSGAGNSKSMSGMCCL